MLTLVEKILFVVAVAVSLYFTYRGFEKIYLIVRRGGPDAGDGDVLKRLGQAAVKWLALLPTWQVRLVPDVFHAMLAWGFTFYFLVNAGEVIQGYFPIVFLGSGPVGDAYRFLADLFSVAVLVGIIYFLIRRFIAKDAALTYRKDVKLMPRVASGGVRLDSLIVGAFILVHVGSHFLGESFDLARDANGVWSWQAGQPFGSLVSALWTGLSPSAIVVGQHVFFWLALGTILAFLPYFTYTKHLHLIVSGISFLVRPQRTSLGTLQTIDFEDESIEQMGAARIEQLPWKQILDSYACIMCNRCQDVCPAYLTGKELSPSALEVNKRYYLNANLSLLAAGQASPDTMLECLTSESALWACTACGACVEVCPVGNEPMFDLMHMRRNQVLMESNFPRELQTAFKGMERNNNPWNLGKRERMAWAKGLEIPTIEDKPEP